MLPLPLPSPQYVAHRRAATAYRPPSIALTLLVPSPGKLPPPLGKLAFRTQGSLVCGPPSLSATSEQASTRSPGAAHSIWIAPTGIGFNGNPARCAPSGHPKLTVDMSSSITPTNTSGEGTSPAAGGCGPRFQSTLALPVAPEAGNEVDGSNEMLPPLPIDRRRRREHPARPLEKTYRRRPRNW